MDRIRSRSGNHILLYTEEITMEQPNLSYIESMSGGDKAFEQKLISIIKSEFTEEKQTYVNAISNKDYKATAEIVHKLKHKISILGLVKSYEIAAAYESNLLEGRIELKDNFDAILTFISNHLKKL